MLIGLLIREKMQKVKAKLLLMSKTWCQAPSFTLKFMSAVPGVGSKDGPCRTD
jgi:hypothetical protein